jgi:hypothetical protein
VKITSFLIWAAAICALPILPSCGTPFGASVANVVSSPITAGIVSMAVQAGESALLAQTGQNFSPEAKAALTSAITPLVNQEASAGLAAIAKALKGTPKVAQADSGKLVAAITSTGAASVPVAVKVAEAVPTIVNTATPGTVTPEAANVAVQAAINSIAAGK